MLNSMLRAVFGDIAHDAIRGRAAFADFGDAAIKNLVARALRVDPTSTSSRARAGLLPGLPPLRKSHGSQNARVNVNRLWRAKVDGSATAALSRNPRAICLLRVEFAPPPRQLLGAQRSRHCCSRASRTHPRSSAAATALWFARAGADSSTRKASSSVKACESGRAACQPNSQAENRKTRNAAPRRARRCPWRSPS